MATREQHQKAETAPWPLLVQVCFLALCFLVLVYPCGPGFTIFHPSISFLSSTARIPLHNSAKKLSGELGRSQGSVFLGGLSGLWVPDHRSLLALQKATRRSIFRYQNWWCVCSGSDLREAVQGRFVLALGNPQRLCRARRAHLDSLAASRPLSLSSPSNYSSLDGRLWSVTDSERNFFQPPWGLFQLLPTSSRGLSSSSLLALRSKAREINLPGKL